ncbi:MAG: SIS domain-containing protein [Anaerolineae bacterium]|nr:SIS domain-containing protein [Anaerolineae bacterium]
MNNRGAHTIAEILSQPTVWADTLDAALRDGLPALRALWQARAPDQVIFTGCGSTHYLAMTGAALFQALVGAPAVARPASELALLPDLAFVPNADTLLVAVSRSGTTSETVEAVRVFRERVGGRVVTVTCDSASTLAQQADVSLAADTAQEQSVAQTRSFSSMAVLCQALAAELSGRADPALLGRLPGILQGLIDAYHATARALGEDASLERFYFLGSGWLFGIASEAMLKMKEMSLSYSEAFHVLEFRHGPMSMVNDQTLVVGLLSDGARRQETAVLRDMHGHGARILALVEDDPDGALAGWAEAVVRLQSGLPEWARAILYLPVLQLLAYYRAMARGQNPDRPAKLEAVVSLGGRLL